MKAYLANGLFSEADRIYNEHIASVLRNNFNKLDLYVPQENGDINDKLSYADSIMIAQADTNELLKSDFMVAVLDGITIDAGVASEIGVFFMTGKPIIGIYTDVRQFGATNNDKLNALNEIAENQFHYVNLYTTGLIKLSGGKIVNNIDDLIITTKELVVAK